MVDFRKRAAAALADDKLRANLRRAMDGLMAKRAAQVAATDDWEALRARGANAKARALARLPDLLRELEERCQDNGIRVHWAETGEQAVAIIAGLLERAGVQRVVKGKSMATEEVHLNRALEREGLDVVESDLGEYVIQLAGETPSHIIMPCIHKNRDEIGRLFEARVNGANYTEDPAELTAIARRVLRDRFREADAGITGVNFLVAETGTLVLVENEGNGRMTTTLPPLHIALAGVDKVVERLDDVPPLLSLLTRSATGQPITTYVNMISGPRRDDEKDGPREVHLVLLDNGRSRIHVDPVLRDTLRCIRCGACMNHCPVYTRVGGHAYGAVYPGPIGKILTPQLDGLARHADLPSASSLCRACVEVCPVEIPIVRILRRLRGDAVVCGGPGRWLERLGWWSWRRMHASPRVYRFGSRLLARLGNRLPAWVPLLRAWTGERSRPRFAETSLHRHMEAMGVDDE